MADYHTFKEEYDVIVIGGGPVGLAATYEIAKDNGSVLLLEQSNFYNSAGSSGDMVRMFRTMYTEKFMAKLAHESMGDWERLTNQAQEPLRSMTGLLNFGEPGGEGNPEGTLLGPVPNLDDLGMKYEKLTVDEIEKRYPFKNLDKKWEGLFAPDNGVINVNALLRALALLCRNHRADLLQYKQVTKLIPVDDVRGERGWQVDTLHTGPPSELSNKNQFRAKKLIITPGAYVNYVLAPSFGIALDVDIWEMTASYFTMDPGVKPKPHLFPSMWFQFAPDKDGKSQLFYGFPTVEWGPPNTVRIAVDAPTRRINDPYKRKANVLDPEDIQNVQNFVKNHVKGVDASCPAYTSGCLQTNVIDNMFVLDYIPEQYLKGGPKDSVVVFTAGWAMKFVPLLGRALKEMVINGRSDLALDEFKITRKDTKGKPIFIETNEPRVPPEKSAFTQEKQIEGSSCHQSSRTS